MSDIFQARPPISRCHTGCSSCRRRGKKCDETKPKCKSCTRLSLACSYVRDIVFLNLDESLQHKSQSPEALRNTARHDQSQPAIHRTCEATSDGVSNTVIPFAYTPKCVDGLLYTQSSAEAFYFRHFDQLIRQDLFEKWNGSFDKLLTSPLAKYAILCLSASHVAALEGQFSYRNFKDRSKSPLQSTAFDARHCRQSQLYFKTATDRLRKAKPCSKEDVLSVLVSKVVLAQYHHAATDHRRFRLAVLESFDFVRLHYEVFTTCANARPILQFWYRIWTSSRLSKPPPLPIEGERDFQDLEIGTLPDVDDHIQSLCNIGLSSDDLVYNIMIKMMELRSRIILNRCAAYLHNVSESHPNISAISQNLLKEKMSHIGNSNCQQSKNGAENGPSFVSGTHLVELVKIQMKRLEVWESMLEVNRTPPVVLATNGEMPCLMNQPDLDAHRSCMNYLYCLLCKLMFSEIQALTNTPSKDDFITSDLHVTKLLKIFFNIVDNLDYTQSNLRDVYKFSLCEVLRYLVYVRRSREIFNHILDIVWPKIEKHGKGFEHSHLPTHIAKRLIIFIAAEYTHGREVLLTFNAVPEDTPKKFILDIDTEVAVVVCEQDVDGVFSLERQVLY